jgi:uncharacterized protein YbaA (DUF1428 family)
MVRSASSSASEMTFRRLRPHRSLARRASEEGRGRDLLKYQFRAHRDAVNAKVMADTRTKESMSNMPFDGKRMIFGGFETFLEA